MIKPKFKIKSNIKSQNEGKKIETNSELWTYAASTWRDLISPFVPYNTGNLCENVTIDSGEIKYNAPYALETYENARKLHFRTDKHPLASAHWDEVAKPSQEGYLVSSLQDFINSGKAKLND